MADSAAPATKKMPTAEQRSLSDPDTIRSLAFEACEVLDVIDDEDLKTSAKTVFTLAYDEADIRDIQADLPAPELRNRLKEALESAACYPPRLLVLHNFLDAIGRARLIRRYRQTDSRKQFTTIHP